MKYRVKNIFNNAKQKPEIILIMNSNEPMIDENFFYVTGLSQGLFESSCALLFPDGNIELLIPEFESDIAEKADVKINIYKDKDDFYNILSKLVGSINILGLNFNNISIKNFLKLQGLLSKIDFIDISSAINKTRLVKDKFEISLIRKACRIADSTMEILPNIIKEGITEYELASEIGYYMQKNGADKPAFDIISSFGVNTAKPHYTHGNKKISNGDFVLCDFGACVNKYNSDITRTFIFNKASDVQKEIYDTVFRAQEIGFEKIKEGVEAFEVHKAVESFINKTKFKGRFIHSSGHSLGMKVHDSDIGFNSTSDILLRENMVFTVEPGIYVSNIGGVRIEDDVLVKRKGFELLSNSSRELIEL